MARISGVILPNDKQVQIALTYIYGIGPKSSADILASAKVEPTVRVKSLTDAEISRIQDTVSASYTGHQRLSRHQAQSKPTNSGSEDQN
jgi:small subunit ribosomal protein S13